MHTHAHRYVHAGMHTWAHTRMPPQLHGGRSVRTQGLLWLHQLRCGLTEEEVLSVCTEAAGSTEGLFQDSVKTYK